MQGGRRLARPVVGMLPGEIVLLVAAPVYDIAVQSPAVRPDHELMRPLRILDVLETPVAMGADAIVRFPHRRVRGYARAPLAGFAIGLRLQQGCRERLQRGGLGSLGRRNEGGKERDNQQRSDSGAEHGTYSRTTPTGSGLG